MNEVLLGILNHNHMCNVQLELKKKESASLVAPYSRTYNRTLISTILQSDDGGVHAVSLLSDIT